MNSQAKSAIKSLVLKLRHLLEDDLAIQLKRYGFAGERWLPVERLPHIHRDDAATRDYYRLQAALEQHLRRIGAEPETAKPAQHAEAVDWFVREVAFTHLNRLAALKVLEVRGLIPEIITAREAYGGRSRAHYDYRNAHPEAAAAPDDGLPDALRHACRQVYAEFKFLFDVGDPAENRLPPADAILWPSYPVLKQCLDLINGLDAAAARAEAEATLWAEDEIIGWLYQFYNAEHKEAVRKRGRPRRPAEVAVINQFFTPRWIVKFLVDNTLGRLWLEMHPDSERVRAKCDYLVPEVAGSKEQGAGSASAGDSSPATCVLLPDSPINHADAPARRAAKPVTEIRLIDPACGTMHFGHYAFEVFQAMYQDSLEHNWPLFAVQNPKSEIQNHDLPALILRHNLYGVDIDLRAVQLAALSLFIKAKTADRAAHITQLNLVVADAVLPRDGARTAFLAQYGDNRKVQEAVRQVLAEMENVAEVGSLLRVEERLRALLREADAPVEGLDPDRQRALPGFGGPQLRLYAATGAAPEQWGAHYTLARLLDDLRAFAARALRTHDLNAQLFAREAEKTVHLLDVFLNNYDVVVMNPPYNKPKEMLTFASNYLKHTYRYGDADLYAAFFERAYEILAPKGYCGALTSRTFYFLATFEEFRRDFLLPLVRICTAADLGFGILDDAAVETSATVIEKESKHTTNNSLSVFLRLLDVEDKEKFLCNVLHERYLSENQVYFTSQGNFDLAPRCSFAYWVPRQLLKVFSDFPPFSEVGDVCMGLSTAADDRFLRYFWELDDIGDKWVPHAKGGEFSRYYQDISLVVNWDENGQILSNYDNSVIRNAKYYFKEGLTYPHDTIKGLNVRYLPSDSTFGAKGPGVFLHDLKNLWFALGVFNSALIQQLMLLATPSRSWSVGIMQVLPFNLPIDASDSLIATKANQAYQCKSAWDTGNETCTRFTVPWLVQIAQISKSVNQQIGESEQEAAGLAAVLALLGEAAPLLPTSYSLLPLLDALERIEQAADARLQALQAQIDETVYDLYEITPADRALIERELGARPPELVWPQLERKSASEKRREHVRRLLSSLLLQALKAKPDGLLPLCAGTGHETALEAVRRGLAGLFGEQAAFHMEGELKQVLGRDLGAWLESDFIKWHTQLYKQRPVIWQLSSGDSRNTFGLFLYIHALDGDTLRKVQTQYLWAQRRAFESERDTARAAEAYARVMAAEQALETLAAFEARLQAVIRGDVAVETPAWAAGPYRAGVYDPVLDDGVKVNIEPLQAGGLLRYKKMV